MSDKAPEAFRTISEVAEELDLPQHVLRFWETRFSQIRPMKRGGGRRYYRPEDVDLLRGIRHILYGEGYTIKGAQRILKERGVRHVAAIGRGEDPDAINELRAAAPAAKAKPVDPLSEYAPKHLRDQALRVEPPMSRPDDEDDMADVDEVDEGFDDRELAEPDEVDAEVGEPDEAAPTAPAPQAAKPAPQAAAPLGRDAERALRSVLYQLQDCRRILRELRGKAQA